MIERLLWLLLAVCPFAWVFDFVALVISSGSPHFEGAGWKQARMDDYERSVHIAAALFYIMPVLFFSSVAGLWFLRRAAKIA